MRFLQSYFPPAVIRGEDPARMTTRLTATSASPLPLNMDYLLSECPRLVICTNDGFWLSGPQVMGPHPCMAYLLSVWRRQRLPVP